MAVTLSANYSKKLGLPQFSSHSFSASVEVELTDLSRVESECQKLYSLLQQSVDQEIQQVGFIPEPHSYGTNGRSNGKASYAGYSPYGNTRPNGSNGHTTTSNGNGDHWNCTEGQRGFLLRIINENKLNKQDVEDLSQQLYQMGMKRLNKLQASQLIEELLAKTGKPSGRTRWSQPRQPQLHEHSH